MASDEINETLSSSDALRAELREVVLDMVADAGMQEYPRLTWQHLDRLAKVAGFASIDDALSAAMEGDSE